MLTSGTHDEFGESRMCVAEQSMVTALISLAMGLVTATGLITIPAAIAGMAGTPNRIVALVTIEDLAST